METSASKRGNHQIKNYVNWFEIPAFNLQRAVAFYSHIYNIEMETIELNGYAMGFFPTSEKGIGGAIVVGQGSIPGETGALIYLNGGDDLTEVLDKIEDAGGRIVMGKTKITGDSGYFALFIDTEGNKLALHSKN